MANMKTIILLLLLIFLNTLPAKADHPLRAQDIIKDIFKVKPSDTEQIKKLSKKLCGALKEELDIKSDIQPFIENMHDVMSKAGANLKNDYFLIERGYITYYFMLNNENLSLDNVKNNVNELLSKNGVGPTFYYLHKDWFEEHWAGKDLKHIYPTAEIYGPYIRLRFTTFVPILSEYTEKGILKSPPEHILKIANKAGLEFVKSERRDKIEYSYSLDLRSWYEILFGVKRYYMIDINVLGKRDNDGAITDINVNKISCTYPYPYGYVVSPGNPPSKIHTVPLVPTEAPCTDYVFWHQCHLGVRTKGCNSRFKHKPLCKPKLLFSEGEYR